MAGPVDEEPDMSHLPPVSPVTNPSTTFLRPHRGAMILTLGILGIIINCGVIGVTLGIIAWVMGNNDLRDMDRGAMDPSGRGMTQAGKICAIIAVCVGAVYGVVIVLWLLGGLAILGAAAAAGSGAGGPPPFLF